MNRALCAQCGLTRAELLYRNHVIKGDRTCRLAMMAAISPSSGDSYLSVSQLLPRLNKRTIWVWILFPSRSTSDRLKYATACPRPCVPCSRSSRPLPPTTRLRHGLPEGLRYWTQTRTSPTPSQTVRVLGTRGSAAGSQKNRQVRRANRGSAGFRRPQAVSFKGGGGVHNMITIQKKSHRAH